MRDLNNVVLLLTALPHPPYTIVAVDGDDLGFESIVCEMHCVILSKIKKEMDIIQVSKIKPKNR